MSKILLVEDDNNLREIYEARLQAEGYTIASAHDGEEALVIAKEQKPDLIISDVMMPKISGFEMLDILRNTDGLKDVKVIMLTALGQSEDQKRADLLGADHYLVKSQVTLEDIVKVAQDLLNKPAAGSPDVSSPATDVPAVASTTVTPTEPPAPTQQPVVPEPVVVPEPDPVQATAPVIVPEPTVHPEITVTPLPAEAQSADDSTASVTSPTEPSVAPVVEPNSIATPEDKAAQEIVSAKNDQVITAAAESLAARTQSIPASPPSAVAKTVQPPASDTAAAPTEPTVGTNVPIAGKKVIQPLGTDDTKPDLDTLLALEEIKASAAPETEVASAAPTGPTHGMLQAQPPTTAPTGEGDPTTPGTAEAPAQAPFDPNSIAL
jgi:CheY-like chemotaxis protein